MPPARGAGARPEARRSPARAGAAACAAAAGSLCALAGSVSAQGSAPALETSPYSIGAGLGLGRDDNLFRAPDGEALSDSYTLAQIFGAVDQTYGRQRLQAQAAWRDHRYRSRRDLDNLGYTGSLSWDGSTEGDVSWAVSHATNRRLAAYATLQDPNFRAANLETVDQTQARVQLGLVAQWAANLALSQRRVDHTALAFERERVHLQTVGASVQWMPTGPLSLSVGPRLTRGRVPLTSDGVARSFKRHDLDVGVNWVATGESVLRARISRTQQDYDVPEQGDFRGTTGQLDWAWTLTGRTRLNTALSRETGSESVFLVPSGAAQTLRGSGDDRQISTALTLRLDHDVTGKITLGLDLQAVHRKLAISRQLAGGSLVQASGSDRSTLARVGLRYAATRSVVLACDVGHERRTSSTTLSAPYRVNTASCNAQLTLRWS
jgi:Putative beta-barrel porin 2